MDQPTTIEDQLDAAHARIAELEQAMKSPDTVAANARADAAEAVAENLSNQLAAVTAERDSLVSEVANLKREAVSVEKRAAQIVASCGINALPLGFGGPVKNGPSGSRAEAVAELEQASKEGPEAFAATYARVKDALIGK